VAVEVLVYQANTTVVVEVLEVYFQEHSQYNLQLHTP
jgi:hypothetical protein